MTGKITAKLSFLFLFLVDLYFVFSGLSYIKTAGEVLYAFLFFIFVWFIVWSVVKIKAYFDENRTGSFLAYYFNYLIKGSEIVTNEPQLGPTKFLRIANVALSALVGVLTLVFLVYKSISTALITYEMILRYTMVFLYVAVYPLILLFIRTLLTQQSLVGFEKTILGSFGIRFVYLFLWIFTFLSPVFAWLAIAFVSYITTKSVSTHREKLPPSDPEKS